MAGRFMPSALMVATMDTEHFTFTACGATDKSAREYMLETWRAHIRIILGGAEPLEGTPDSVEALEDHYGINVTRVFAGMGMRDHTQIWTKERA